MLSFFLNRLNILKIIMYFAFEFSPSAADFHCNKHAAVLIVGSVPPVMKTPVSDLKK